MIEQILGVVLPVFSIAVIGYLWARLRQPFDNATVSSLVMMIGSPCLIYSSLTSNAPEAENLARVAGSALLAITGSALLGWIMLRFLGLSRRTYLPALTHANSGNMGLPLVLMAFGEEGLALGMAFFFVSSVSQFTLGISLASGHFQVSQLFRQPVVWAVVVVLLVLNTDLKLPAWFDATAQILGGLTIPAMLLMLGTSLATLNLSALKQSLGISALRLILGFTMGLTAIAVFDLSGVLAGVVILQATMPAAVFNYVFAERFGGEHDKVAAVVLQSTLMSVLILPFLVGFALSF